MSATKNPNLLPLESDIGKPKYAPKIAPRDNIKESVENISGAISSPVRAIEFICDNP